MQIPVIKGVIDRRILVNFQIDPEWMDRALPTPFRAKRVNGYAIGGICLIRLKHVRPRFFPLPWGIQSENAAHRIAVEWEVDGKMQEGVYIPRRDSNSRLNGLVGGRIFPGVHHLATFTVQESASHYHVALQSQDGDTRVSVTGTIADQMPEASVFNSVAEASDFFERGALGYSATRRNGRFDGLELRCHQWQVQPLAVEHVESSYFADTTRFPEGTVQFDCGLLMQNIEHEWHGRADLCV